MVIRRLRGCALRVWTPVTDPVCEAVVAAAFIEDEVVRGVLDHPLDYSVPVGCMSKTAAVPSLGGATISRVSGSMRRDVSTSLSVTGCSSVSPTEISKWSSTAAMGSSGPRIVTVTESDACSPSRQ